MSTLLGLPMWAAGTLAALALACCVVAFTRAGYEGMIGIFARVGLVLIGAAATWFLLGAPSASDGGAQQRALDARGTELAARAIMPGSALACLDAAAGDAVEAACEKALFASPESTAAAVSYVSAQLALLADATTLAEHDAAAAKRWAPLRRAVETDRFGIVAHILGARDGCSAEQCEAFALLNDRSHVRANMSGHTYASNVERYAAGWPGSSGPVASTTQESPVTASNAASGLPLKPPGPNVFFPSAASIPPVSIMTTEPPVAPPVPHQETTGSAAPLPKPPPSRKAAPVRKPVDLNAEASRAAPASAAQ